MASATFETTGFFLEYLTEFFIDPRTGFTHQDCMIVEYFIPFKYTTRMEENQDQKQPDRGVEQAYDELVCALSRCEDSRLIGEFLRCLLTPAELQAVSSRWALVREIDAGTTQREIAKTMGLSLCKITRGSRELKKENSPFKRMIDICLSER